MYELAWIGLATGITFVITTLILVPQSEAKQIVNLLTKKMS
jgi:hypothetical protein